MQQKENKSPKKRCSFKIRLVSNTENIILGVCGISFLVGGLLDKYIFGLCCVRESYFYTVVQIQATMASMGIAILALITPKIGYKVYGIDLADYAVNKSNKILKQYVVIIAIIVLVTISLALLLLECYASVLAIFMVSIILLVFEFMQIKEIFASERSHQARIYDYLMHNMLSDIDVMKDFLKAFRDGNLEMRSHKEIEEDIHVRNNLWKKFLSEGINEELFRVYTDGLTESVKGLLASQRADIKEQGIDYILQIYSTYMQSACKYEISLFSYVENNMLHCLSSLSYSGLRQAIIYIPYFFVCTDKFKSISKSDHMAISDYLNFMPSVLKEQSSIKEIDSVLTESCRRFVRDILFGTDFERSDEKLHIQCDYFVSLINNGFVFPVQQIFFEEYFQRLPYQFSVHQGRYGLIILLYLFYAARKETPEHLYGGGITKNIAINLLKENGQAINNFISDGFYHSDLFSMETLKLLKEFLTCYERGGLNGVKVMIADSVTDEFFVINAAIHAVSQDQLIDILKPFVSLNGFKYYSMFVASERHPVIIELLNYVLSNYRDGKIKYERSEKIYSKLTGAICKIYADQDYEAVLLASEKFDEQNIKNVLESEIFDCVENMLSENNLCRQLPDANKKCVSYDKKQLLVLDTPILNGREDDILQSVSFSKEEMFYIIIEIMIEKALLSADEGIQSDKEMITWLEGINEGDILLGSSPVGFFNYTQSTLQVSSLLRHHKTFFTCNKDEIIAIESQKVGINIKAVHVNIRQYNDEEIVEKVKQQEEEYRVLITNDIYLPYTKEQAENYVKNKHRIIEVFCDFDVEYLDGYVGRKVKMEKCDC